MDLYGVSQTVSQQVFADTSGGYGSTILSSTSATYAQVGSAILTFSSFNPRDGMKLYAMCRCAIEADSSSACSVIIRVNDNGTTADLAESEMQSDLVGGNKIVTMLGAYTLAHCGTTGTGTLTVALMGKRVVGSGAARVINPIAFQVRLARD